MRHTWVSVGLDRHDPKKMAGFEKIIKTFPEVVQCHLIAGQTDDYMLQVLVQNLSQYQELLLKKLTQVVGVKTIHSSFVLRSIVDTSALPLNHL